LNTVHKTYEGIVTKLTSGSGNLMRQASALEELGVKVKKKLPKNWTDNADYSET
jgi:DNA recombination protein RmuC